MKDNLKILALLVAWFVFVAYTLRDAGVPYQCSTDTECEALHGADE